MRRLFWENYFITRRNGSVRDGFTFLELLIAIGILMILGALLIPAFLNFYLRNQLDLEAKEITLALRTVQSRSISRESESYWGMHIVNAASGSDYVETFYNSSTPAYAGAKIVSVSYVPSGVEFATPASGNTQDVIFNQVSGTVTAGSVSLVLRLTRDATATKIITISASGLVSFLRFPDLLYAYAD